MGTHRAVISGDGAFTGRKWVRWTQKMREGFLDHLAATCNVKSAAESIGVDPVSVYALRRREPKFADAWGEALALGYEMLETQLVGHALGGGDPKGNLDNGAETKAGAVSVDMAMKLLALHRAPDGKPRRGGPKRQFAKPEETDALLMKKLDAIERRRARDAAKAAAVAAENETGEEAR